MRPSGTGGYSSTYLPSHVLVYLPRAGWLADRPTLGLGRGVGRCSYLCTHMHATCLPVCPLHVAVCDYHMIVLGSQPLAGLNAAGKRWPRMRWRCPAEDNRL